MTPRRPSIESLPREPYDVVVIGGGINGAGIARDAALRGFRVALFEQDDFASGTSSRSSKLIHGGIRYLEQGHLPLVYESSRERRILLRIAPHLVRPIPFLFPVYGQGAWGRIRLDLGLWLYDLLSLFQNIRPHRMLSRDETLRREPDLLADGLDGAAIYYDAQMDDARICLANALEARSKGAEVRNYTRVTALIRDDEGRVRGVRIRDRIDGREAAVHARVVVNAAGPWVDEVCRMDAPTSLPTLRRTRGSHLILPALTRGYALVIRSRKEGRVLFVIPWHGMSLVGTTDVDYDGDPGKIHCPPEDRDELLQEARRFFPNRPIERGDVIASFAGIRPLVSSGAAAAVDVSREERILEGGSGLISITGGKFTTYRRIAEKVVDRIHRRLPETEAAPCVTATRPLWGGDIADLPSYLKAMAPELVRREALQPDQAEHLITAYGTRHARILELVRQDPPLRERLHPSLPHLKAEVIHAVREEAALTLSDVLRRRTSIALGPHRADEALIRRTLEIMASELSWSPEEIETQRRNYREDLL